jgi:hypothetical protein
MNPRHNRENTGTLFTLSHLRGFSSEPVVFVEIRGVKAVSHLFTLGTGAGNNCETVPPPFSHFRARNGALKPRTVKL